jgi:hypothetical protein
MEKRQKQFGVPQVKRAMFLMLYAGSARHQDRTLTEAVFSAVDSMVSRNITHTQHSQIREERRCYGASLETDADLSYVR